MRINIEASAEELAEIGLDKQLFLDRLIDAIDDRLSLPGYMVTVNEPSAIQAQLVEALQLSLEEAIYPARRMSHLQDICNAALAAAGAQP